MPENNRGNTRLSLRQQQQLDVAIGFLEGLVRRDPEYLDALQLLGDSYTRRGRQADGRRVDERLLQLQPGNPVAHYNLACRYSLNGQMDEAADALQRALELGFRDFHWLIRDPDLHRLRLHPAYQRVEASIRTLRIHVE